MNKVILTILMLAGFCCARAQMYPQSRVVTDTIYSEVLKAKRAYTVYLPAAFDQQPERKFPILYLLHGMGGVNSSWVDDMSLKDISDRLTASGEMCEMVIVTPDAGGDPNVCQNGYFDLDDWKYETFFYTEFLPTIEATYRAIGDKQHRAIAGLSMGGGGTTSYAQRHTDMYCAAYAMSALMTIPIRDAVTFDDPNSKVGKLTRSVIEHSCIDYVTAADDARKAELRTVAWFVDCGDDDFLLDRNIEFYQAMRNAGIPCQLRVRDGAHDREYWHTALYQCLPFVARNFSGK